jgi:hypothetical protein
MAAAWLIVKSLGKTSRKLALEASALLLETSNF